LLSEWLALVRALGNGFTGSKNKGETPFHALAKTHCAQKTGIAIAKCEISEKIFPAKTKLAKQGAQSQSITSKPA